MDGRGRIAQPLTWIARLRARPPTRPARLVKADDMLVSNRFEADPRRPFLQRLVRRSWFFLLRNRLPRGVGVTAAALVVVASIVSRAIKRAHVPTLAAKAPEAAA